MGDMLSRTEIEIDASQICYGSPDLAFDLRWTYGSGSRRGVIALRARARFRIDPHTRAVSPALHFAVELLAGPGGAPGAATLESMTVLDLPGAFEHASAGIDPVFARFRRDCAFAESVRQRAPSIASLYEAELLEAACPNAAPSSSPSGL